MPNVEELLRESRVYPFCIANATHTNYASLVPLSSQYPLRSAQQYIYEPQPPYPHVLIYDILKPLGYHTAVISSQNEYWGGMFYYLNSGNIDHFVHGPTYNGPTYVPWPSFGLADLVFGEKRAGKIDDRYTVGAALDWLDSLHAQGTLSDPFFIYMNLQSSHLPYLRPADFPPRFGSGVTSFTITFGRYPPDSALAVMDMYDNSLAYADAQIGRLMGYLTRHDLWQSTVIVLTGDHGQAFFEHGFAGHGQLPFAELANVPLLIRAPGLRPAIDHRPAQHVDVAPTILSILGLPEHPAFQGLDLTASTFRPDRPMFTVAQTPLANGYSVVEGPYTLILDATHDSEMLFDDGRDPSQHRDLTGQLPEVEGRLRHDLDMWREVQLNYYARKADQRRWYVPHVRFEPSSK